jgi:hypothetical protein
MDLPEKRESTWRQIFTNAGLTGTENKLCFAPEVVHRDLGHETIGEVSSAA